MTHPNPIRDPWIADGDLIDALKDGLEPSIVRDRGICQLVRRASHYQSSYPLEELRIIFDDGDQLNLLFKNVSPRALSPMARQAKPQFLDDPYREISVYRTILGSVELGTPH